MQWSAYLSEKSRLIMARNLLLRKVLMQEKMLKSAEIKANFQKYHEKIRKRRTINELLGMEGAISAQYFTKFAGRVPPPFSFSGRNRRPALDPVNALLSLSYALGGQQVGRTLSQKGFEVEVGYLHSLGSGRPSLMFDVLEPLRPLLDDWVIKFLKNNAISPEDFSFEQGGCRLKKTASGLYYAAFYRENFLEKALRSEMAALLRTLKQLIPITFLKMLEIHLDGQESDDFN